MVWTRAKPGKYPIGAIWKVLQLLMSPAMPGVALEGHRFWNVIFATKSSNPSRLPGASPEFLLFSIVGAALALQNRPCAVQFWPFRAKRFQRQMTNKERGTRRQSSTRPIRLDTAGPTKVKAIGRR